MNNSPEKRHKKTRSKGAGFRNGERFYVVTSQYKPAPAAKKENEAEKEEGVQAQRGPVRKLAVADNCGEKVCATHMHEHATRANTCQ
ncbi:hypothetical protein [Gallaecimonas sp. GXIMD1310]|uniref:hypothetical protein n=1 Tax=Gallaecimonas sp. GXIMD1310 TaxID=3131926 RepID=UPI00325570D5